MKMRSMILILRLLMNLVQQTMEAQPKRKKLPSFGLSTKFFLMLSKWEHQTSTLNLMKSHTELDLELMES